MTDAAGLQILTVVGDNLTLDLILWRRDRRLVPGIVEQTLALNPGLADLGPILPPGTVIRLPVPVPAALAATGAVRLWD